MANRADERAREARRGGGDVQVSPRSRERSIPPEQHHVLDDDHAGQDDVRTLGLESVDAAPLPQRQRLQTFADRDDVGLPEQETVTLVTPAAGAAQMHAGECPDGAAPADDRFASPGRRQQPPELIADGLTQGAKLLRSRRIVGQEAPGEANGAKRQARDGHDLSIADPARFLARAQHGHVHTLLAPEGTQQSFTVFGVPDGGGGEGENAWAMTILRTLARNR